jgi:uncharacterized protein (DUF1778 family)
MRQITLRVPDELHDLAANAANEHGQSLNTFATNALLSQVRAKSYSEWRAMVEQSHRSTRYRGLSAEGVTRLATLTGDESR